MLADAYMARYATAPTQETAAELGTRLVRKARTVALDRALANLGRGVEAHEVDVELFRGDPHMHLRYLDARDEALGQHGDELAWEPEPAPEPEPESDDA
jgi:hypothetical protein